MPGTCPLVGISQLGRFSAGLATAGMCRCTREEHSNAWEQPKVNACIWCNTHLPGTGTGTGTAPLRDEAAGDPITYQPNSPFWGRKGCGGSTHQLSSPQEVISQEKSACGGGFYGWGSKSLAPAQFPSIELLHSPGLQLGLWASAVVGRQRGEGEPKACGGGRLGRPSAGMLGSARSPLPQPLPPAGTLGSTEMGVKPCGHPQGGQGEPGLLGKGAGGEWDSQASMVKGKQLFFAQRRRHRVQVLQASRLVGAWLGAGPSLPRFGQRQPHPG